MHILWHGGRLYGRCGTLSFCTYFCGNHLHYSGGLYCLLFRQEKESEETKDISFVYKGLEEKLKRTLGTKVEIRNKSDYLTKFIVAGAVGLFDGALNFLWDEIIRTLREKIIQYDLAYFYSIAEQINFQYKKLSSPEDLEVISDYDLLQILKRINFLDDFAFNTLSNINYLRNHASAAHPNVNELTGIKLSSLLEDGIKYAIMLEPDASSIEVKKLFNNIKNRFIRFFLIIIIKCL